MDDQLLLSKGCEPVTQGEIIKRRQYRSTILLVEDHAMSREMLRTLPGYMGHRILEAADGSAGLALARSERPDLIISDILMPTMDGIEFVRLLRSYPVLLDTPVIFYTAAFKMPEVLQKAEAFGNCRTIEKPSEPSFLLWAVSEMLGISTDEPESQEIKELPPKSRSIDDHFQKFAIQITTLLVQQVWQELRREQEGRKLEMEIGYLPVCQADPALLKQVLVKLLSNALKYTRKQPVGKVEVGSRQDEKEHVVFIKDNGVGFDMHYAHKLFGVFERLHRAEDYEGTGVGLAIVQRTVLRHGGRVCLQNFPDRWGMFRCSGSVTVNEIFSLIGHAMLNGYASSQRLNSFDVFLASCLSVVKEPMKAPLGLPLRRQLKTY